MSFSIVDFGLAMICLVVAAGQSNATYDAVVKGMSCKQQSSGQLDCEYSVGRSLRFAIAGVGQSDAAVTFYKVDWDGDYFASVGVSRGCVIVKPASSNRLGSTAMAFVSSRTGKVFRDIRACEGR